MQISRLNVGAAAAVLALMATPAMAQKWEFGLAGGGSVFAAKSASAGTASASAGFKPGFAAGAFIGQTMNRLVSGEIRYSFERNQLKLSSGGTQATFSAQAHAVHYDVLIHTAPTGAKKRPYFFIGGGAKQYRGTGKEVVFQPLQNIALLTHTDEVKPLISVGAGVKIQVGQRTFARLELRDYITPFPTRVIEPVPPTKLGGLIHSFMPMVSLSFTF